MRINLKKIWSRFLQLVLRGFTSIRRLAFRLSAVVGLRPRPFDYAQGRLAGTLRRFIGMLRRSALLSPLFAFARKQRVRPVSLAVKCQLMFGLAVVITIVLALILPYIWMRQLVKTDYLDTERARVETLLFKQHFQLKARSGDALASLDKAGNILDPNNPRINWIRFAGDGGQTQKQLGQLTEKQRQTIESLKVEESGNDTISFEKKDDIYYSEYVRIIRATDNCISCHNPQGSAGAFSANEVIGAIIIQSPAGEISKTGLLNWVWLGVAGLIAGTGAIIAFYWITQRVILSPIRQLRALANNVAEGNLDIRSAIKTGDEYEKLAGSFNHMLDGLQAAQEKLRQTNQQLDAKIAELSERNIELFKANKLKGEFLANISHEFRTPLNAIIGFAQVLREKPGVLHKDKTRRYAENIITAGNRLLGMINDLLELAKTRAGKVELHIEKVSLPEVIDAAVASFSLQTRSKKIKVKVVTEPNLPTLITDAGKVQQIVYNFLSNAVKFTPDHGRVEIWAGPSPVAGNMASVSSDEQPVLRSTAEGGTLVGPVEPGLEPRFVRITVSDTGCGIAEENKEKIFEKFRQIDGSLTRETAGSGLGLTICRELAVLLAGSIGMESEVGKGSKFWLDIPITLTNEQEAVN
jgi:two-component system sensor histidine kinase BarA